MHDLEHVLWRQDLESLLWHVRLQEGDGAGAWELLEASHES